MTQVSHAANALNAAPKIDIGDEWFEVIKLPRDVLAIAEPGHWQEVISFLIVGTLKSVLFDTGMGIGDISRIVGQLTNTDVMVVNSHTHFDRMILGVDKNFRKPPIIAHMVEMRMTVYDHDICIR